MRNCYNTVENDYVCEQIKINCLYADSVLSDYKIKRYGIKSCKSIHNKEEIEDLYLLLNYVLQMDLDSFDKNTYRNKLYLEERLNDLNGKGCLSDFKILNTKICNISDLIEQINSK